MSKKGKIKNGRNKAKHSKLLAQKKNRIKSKKELQKEKLAIINKKINELKNGNGASK